MFYPLLSGSSFDSDVFTRWGSVCFRRCRLSGNHDVNLDSLSSYYQADDTDADCLGFRFWCGRPTLIRWITENCWAGTANAWLQILLHTWWTFTLDHITDTTLRMGQLRSGTQCHYRARIDFMFIFHFLGTGNKNYIT